MLDSQTASRFARVLPTALGVREMERDKVECEAHGEARSTFVCKHLLGARGIGWYSAAPDATDPWPDAWCEQCHAAFESEGEWNEVSEAKTEIKLLCHHCYESTKARCHVHYI